MIVDRKTGKKIVLFVVRVFVGVTDFVYCALYSDVPVFNGGGR